MPHKIIPVKPVKAKPKAKPIKSQLVKPKPKRKQRKDYGLLNKYSTWPTLRNPGKDIYNTSKVFKSIFKKK